ncbi:MAG: PilZ domain-containing protein [Sphingomonas sp.]
MAVHQKIEKVEPRSADRARVLMSATVVTSTGTHKVTIRDVSRTGVQIAAKDKMPLNTDVLFKRGSLSAAAHVTWVNGGEAGLRFYRELTFEEIEGALPSALLR